MIVSGVHLCSHQASLLSSAGRKPLQNRTPPLLVLTMGLEKSALMKVLPRHPISLLSPLLASHFLPVFLSLSLLFPSVSFLSSPYVFTCLPTNPIPRSRFWMRRLSIFLHLRPVREKVCMLKGGEREEFSLPFSPCPSLPAFFFSPCFFLLSPSPPYAPFFSFQVLSMIPLFCTTWWRLRCCVTRSYSGPRLSSCRFWQ